MAPILGIYASQISGHLFAPSGAYESIATVTVGGAGAATIDFTSIPATYTHLQIRGIGRLTRTGQPEGVAIARINGDTTTANYRSHLLYGDGASAGASDYSGIAGMYGIQCSATTSTSQIMGVTVLDLLDYANVSKYKTGRILTGYDKNGAGEMRLYSGLWMSTSAINQITLVPYYGTAFEQYSQFALYGIKGA
jgi:hypothetical protein